MTFEELMAQKNRQKKVQQPGSKAPAGSFAALMEQKKVQPSKIFSAPPPYQPARFVPQAPQTGSEDNNIGFWGTAWDSTKAIAGAVKKTADKILPGYKPTDFLNPMMPPSLNKSMREAEDKILNFVMDKTVNTEKGKQAVGWVARNSEDLPAKGWAGLKAIGDGTYREAMEGFEKGKNNPENSQFKKILYGAQSAIPQTAIGVLLSLGAEAATRGKTKGILGKTLASTYFGSISANEQIQDKGRVYSPGNILIDTVGDQLLAGSLTNLFKKATTSTFMRIAKDFGIEGGTETMQSLMKMANDFRNAPDDQSRNAILERAKQYVVSGEMLTEFLVGGIAGGAISGAAGPFSGNTTNTAVEDDDDGSVPPDGAPIERGAQPFGDAPQVTSTASPFEGETGPLQPTNEPFTGAPIVESKAVDVAPKVEPTQTETKSPVSIQSNEDVNKVDDLTTEARKYKSAEEFVSNQTPRVGGIAPELKGQTLYRGMSETEWKSIQEGGLSGKRGDGRTYLTTEKETAQMAVDEGIKSGKGKGVIVELKPEAGQKVISGGKIGENTGGNLRGEYQGKDIGIDDIARVTDGNGKVIYEATTGGKTKSQLTDIWKKANESPAKKATTKKESKPAKKKVPTEVDKKTEKLKSRVYERLQQEQPQSLTDEVTYDAMKLNKDAEAASRLVMEDKDKAYRIAMGMEESTTTTSTAISIALAEQARAEGNIELYNKLTINRSLRQTRLGQELVAEKGSVSDNSLTRYVKQLLHIRLEALGSSWTADIKQKVPGQKKKSAVARAMDVIDSEVKEAKSSIKKTKAMDIGEAQKLIDSLKC